MLRGPWRETTTPHTVQYVLVSVVALGLMIDAIAVAIALLSWMAGDGFGTFLFWLAQWTALMVPIGIGWGLWHEREVFWRQYKARARRRSLNKSEFDI